jgi:DNA-binding CsgD family transcriptional regulator/DNA-binding winged helix-turn-helix (wHTH) protein
VSALVIDERRKSAYLDGREVQLTPQEYRVLHRLSRAVDQVVSKPDLLAAMWSGANAEPGEAAPYDPAAVDLVIFRLRQKLADPAKTARLIETRRGFGYILHHAQIKPAERSGVDTMDLDETNAPIAPGAAQGKRLERAWSGLTRREWELFLLLGDEQATRLTNRALAHHLQMSEGTLKKHLQHIYRKVGVENRSAAALLAAQARLALGKAQV